ncbi:hypothetical protein BH10ACI2_BH10ACI2_02250 [soil metagenome]
MFLFILESIGTQELILVGIVALIFLGPRKLPEIAKKAGKFMTEFRGTANEFKETWQREVNFEEEAKALSLSELDSNPVARVESISAPEPSTVVDAPAIKAADPSSFEHLITTKTASDVPAEANKTAAPETASADATDLNDKKNWL